MNILAIETSGPSASVGIFADRRALAGVQVAQRHGHAATLVPQILEALAQSGLNWPDLTAIAITTGPGSFTGLRVGLAAAYGLALSHQLPVLGFTSLQVLAAMAQATDLPDNAALLTTMDSRRRDIYAQLFDRQGKPLAEAAALLPDQPDTIKAYLTPSTNHALFIAGERGAELAKWGQTLPNITTPDVATLAQLATHYLKNHPAPTSLPDPFYLRPPDISQPKDKALAGRQP